MKWFGWAPGTFLDEKTILWFGVILKVKVHNLSINSSPLFLPLWPLLEMCFIVLPTCFSSDICRRNTLSFGCNFILKNNLIWNCFIPVLYGHWSDHMLGGGGTGMILMSYFSSTETWLRLDCVLLCFIKFHFHTYSFNNQIKVGWYQIVHDYIFNYHHNRLGSVSL